MSKDFRQILQQHAVLLGRVSAAYESNFHLWQELLQEISLGVWQSSDKLKGECSVKTYVLRFANNIDITNVADN